MSVGSLRRNRLVQEEFSIWPGFVDVFATLIIVMLFALMIFVVTQFYLSDALSGSERNVQSLRTKIQEVSQLLGLEQKKSQDLHQSLLLTSDQLKTLQQAKAALEASLGQEQIAHQSANVQLAALQQELSELNQQLQKISEAFQLSESTKEQQKIEIADLGKKLNDALATKVKELEKYRSEFFGKLKDVLGERSDIRIVGDRFVFSSEVLFGSGAAVLEKKGQEKLNGLAKSLKIIAKEMPADLNWVLRVDGHTDDLPIHTDKFDSNWELSTARALAVVKYLEKQGIPAKHLAAAGFGQYHPLEAGSTDNARAKNRRIELKLDQG
ncbi:putative lipoprotein YiaD precursor [Candidatus Bealeia paramacronuclearis]|uniref:Lipoprotein YiaD n=2 Tax=Candidatus Bealeia paramacronuclearis TaxID=1921001 RepID=A0ABZ2C2I4_9PROT|nr:putative lipoprotein YiaD precursor [Candidatus Bealeia paramacronuclearis]